MAWIACLPAQRVAGSWCLLEWWARPSLSRILLVVGNKAVSGQPDLWIYSDSCAGMISCNQPCKKGFQWSFRTLYSSLIVIHSLPSWNWTLKQTENFIQRNTPLIGQSIRTTEFARSIATTEGKRTKIKSSLSSEKEATAKYRRVNITGQVDLKVLAITTEAPSLYVSVLLCWK